LAKLSLAGDGQKLDNKFFRCGRPHFLGAKKNNFGLVAIYGVSSPHGQGGGLSQ